MKWRCSVCNYLYDEEKEGTPFLKLPADWRCPVCPAPKSAFSQLGGARARGASTEPKAQIKDNGCNCLGCGVFSKYELKGGWFCIYGKEGKKI